MVLVAFLFQDLLSDRYLREVRVASLVGVERSALFAVRVALRNLTSQVTVEKEFQFLRRSVLQNALH